MAVDRVVVEADGGARGNPGPAGYGAVVRDDRDGQVLIERSDAIGVATNNVAEYRGLIAGLEAAAELGASRVAVRMDSKLVVEQMCGRWQIRNQGLRPLAARAAALVSRFAAVDFEWVPRDRNRHADALANAAMDQAASGSAGSAGSAGSRTNGSAANGSAAEADPGPRAGAPVSWEPRPSSTATRLLLVRHGETEFTARRRYSGRGDVPLTDLGRRQAAAVAGRVAGLCAQVAAVVSSPLGRCTATARSIAAATGDPPLVIRDDLIECDFGEWEGRTFAEVHERWPAEQADWLGSPAVAPPGGESFVEVATRVRRAVADLVAAYPKATIAVVSHVSPIKLILRDALAAGDSFLHRLYLDAAGLSVVDYWPDGGVAVRSVNEVAHLAD
ncbi:bifunctional RNase H/acid phosphatase [Plantactinospora sp. KBS50]|uniref:bifunctional RNase H/acid phosphatase n=1 Tax=Plantactinospora sp. KBS50 TaxID=2024580 RepID=UPI000BAAF98F|nr:bifunctional RNase H/acid phosphatase [Plantactinospora sp. KBS50]ASW56134.1 bifunctional RNase H/acid phosphatase [Plantactinospora sp. KBS50]